ncbi:pyridoxamine 5'-phosphate oxidase family protein [Mycobacterium sp. pV006]|uniref:pyridoxamine 5'-phosphate oxidase family protein n=1 Tax=Mycobacterium sp. pV006 TaxID=3238983 RepID=UPI00351ADFB1
MSVKVDIDRLADTLGDFTFAYLVTVGDDFRAHTVAVDPVLVDGVLQIASVGNSTRRNAAAHPDVTLVWPPRQPGGYTLIVDGHATTDEQGLHVGPTGAVLHRKPGPDSPPSATGCGDDCVPLRS